MLCDVAQLSHRVPRPFFFGGGEGGGGGQVLPDPKVQHRNCILEQVAPDCSVYKIYLQLLLSTYNVNYFANTVSMQSFQCIIGQKSS